MERRLTELELVKATHLPLRLSMPVIHLCLGRCDITDDWTECYRDPRTRDLVFVYENK